MAIATPSAVPTPGRTMLLATAVMTVALVLAPVLGVYPVFLMKALCFALFACAFNLLIGFGGLLSFGHAMFLGSAGYVCAHAAKEWGWPPEFAILAGTFAAAVMGVVAIAPIVAILLALTIPLLRVVGTNPRVMELLGPFVHGLLWGVLPLMLFTAFRRDVGASR